MKILGAPRLHLVKSRDWRSGTASRASLVTYKLRSKKIKTRNSLFRAWHLNINKNEFKGGIIACTQRAGILVLIVFPYYIYIY